MVKNGSFAIERELRRQYTTVALWVVGVGSRGVCTMWVESVVGRGSWVEEVSITNHCVEFPSIYVCNMCKVTLSYMHSMQAYSVLKAI